MMAVFGWVQTLCLHLLEKGIPTLRYLRMAWKYADFGLKELYRSLRTAAQVKQLQRYIPEITVHDVEQGPAGVRAAALDEYGDLIHDFLFDSGVHTALGRVLHVRNAPSPAATSSLAIAGRIADRIEDEFHHLGLH
eukprot:m.213600 g.213600  ORF g.213600 m.213600 type:complete len:136 (-) comp16956_c1_seq12:255-662(-)